MSRSCFENHETLLTSWASFQQDARTVFYGDHRTKRGKDTFRTEIQDPQKTVASFIEGILRLLQLAYPDEMENRMVDFLIREDK